MIGAIAGDVIGSRFEFENTDTKEFKLFNWDCRYTDDTVMTCAVAKALTLAKYKSELEDNFEITSEFITDVMQYVGQDYPRCGFGAKFIRWMYSDNPEPYNSCGNGSAMRISPVGFYAKTEEECKKLAYMFSAVSHNHPEGIKGAECTAMCIFLAKQGKDKEEIKKYVEEHYYDLGGDTVKDCREFNAGQHGKEICQIAVPQALICFFEGESYEDVIRNCVSIGGDTDTVGAIAGGIAEAYYGVPNAIANVALFFLDDQLKQIYMDFKDTFDLENII